jgi:hypothetical protein
MHKIILQCHAGGLGDALLTIGTLPELWVREQNAEVYVVDGFRNSGIKDLVTSNPFIKGLLPPGTPCTHIMNDDKKLRRLCLKYNNTVKGMEAFFGFEPKHEYLKTYFPLTYKPEYANKVLFDYVAITAPFDNDSLGKYIQHLVDCELINIQDLTIVDTKVIDTSVNVFPDLPRITPTNIFDYANMIFSCKAYVTVSSGACALASAIKGPNPYPKVYSLIHQAIYNKKIWKWNNIEYFVTGKKYWDFDNF